jgi:hypothetical protein
MRLRWGIISWERCTGGEHMSLRYVILRRRRVSCCRPYGSFTSHLTFVKNRFLFCSKQNNATVRIQFRLLASVPPIVLGIFERQLGRITDYAGTTGFIIGFTFPALLWLRSRSLAQSKQASTTTYYTSYASHQGVAWFVLLFGICMALYVVVDLVLA